MRMPGTSHIQENHSADSSYAFANGVHQTNFDIPPPDTGVHDSVSSGASADSSYAFANGVHQTNFDIPPPDTGVHDSVSSGAITVWIPVYDHIGFRTAFRMKRLLPTCPDQSSAQPDSMDPQDKDVHGSMSSGTQQTCSKRVVIAIVAVLVLVLLAAVAATLCVTVFNEENQAEKTAGGAQEGKPPVDGIWNDWQAWSNCSKSCDNGDGGDMRNRTRDCNNPQPDQKGQDCVGPASETSTCGEVAWTKWTDCSVTCGEGVSRRTKICDNSAGGESVGANLETQVCRNQFKCYDNWVDWSECSFTCGGMRTRNRTCEGNFTGQECGWDVPTFKDTKTCEHLESCEVDFCASRNANCSYKHPNRCDLFITCDAVKNMHETPCNVLMRYEVNENNECEGFCAMEQNVQCSL